MNDLTPNKFSAYRARKKAAGLREVRMWVPDVSNPEFLKKLAKDMEITSAQNSGDTTEFRGHNRIPGTQY